MFAFAVILMRLLGLWLIASRLVDLLVVVLIGFDWIRVPSVQMTQDVLVFSLLVNSVPVVSGLLLFLFARPLARVIVPAESVGDAAVSIPERAFTQIGVVLIGLFVIVRVLPRVVAPYLDGNLGPPDTQNMVELALGLFLILGSGLLGGLVGWLRRLS